MVKANGNDSGAWNLESGVDCYRHFAIFKQKSIVFGNLILCIQYKFRAK
jgi:hypothetical protein